MAANARRLRFVISRSNAGASLLQGARQLAAAIGKRTQTRLDVSVAYDHAALLKALLGGGADLAWMPPLIHARAAAAGAQLVAVSQRGGRLGYHSAIVVRPDSRWSTLRELAGARAAWVDPASASGYVFPRLHVLAAGLDPARVFASERFYGSTIDACRAVSTGEADVAACFLGSAEKSDDAQREVDRTLALQPPLRVLDVTGAIPPDGFVTAPQLDAAERDQLRDALLELHAHADGRAALLTLLQAERLAPVAGALTRELHRLLAHAPG